MFEVERKVLFHCARQGQQTLTACGTKIFNYAIFGVLQHRNAHQVRYMCAKSYR
jgi:hypothetical protein